MCSLLRCAVNGAPSPGAIVLRERPGWVRNPTLGDGREVQVPGTSRKDGRVCESERYA